MNSAPATNRIQTLLYWGLVLFAFTLPITIVLAEPLAIAVGVLWLVALRDRDARRAAAACPYLIPLALFAAMAVACSAWGVRPAESLHKCHRLMVLLVVPAVGWIGMRRGQPFMQRMAYAYIAGSVLLALYDAVRVPWEMGQGTPLFHTGNMRDPQMYMVALCLLAGMWSDLTGKRQRLTWVGAALASAFGLLIHFKRGVWAAMMISVLVMGAMMRRWKTLVVVLLLAAATLLLPQVRERIESMKELKSIRYGGRYALWTQAAPDLIREYPMGMGYHGTRREDFLRHVRTIQPKLNHLHNNVLQVTVELGWLGLAVWLYLVGTAGVTMFRAWLRTRGQPGGWVALGAFGGFVGLMLNGLVEYNFGDTEILMLICLLMGLSCRTTRRDECVA